MKKKLVCLSFVLVGIALVISGCAPELARTNYGPEEQQWKNYVQGCYNTWTPPPPPAPYSENSTSTTSSSAGSEIESVPLATTAETTIPVAAVEEPVLTQPVVEASSVEAATAPESTPVTYTVKKGDSLWIISKKVYGDGKYWKKILDANKAKLPSPSSVREGMVLNVPAK